MRKLVLFVAAAAMVTVASCGPKQDRFVIVGSAADSLCCVEGAQVLISSAEGIDTVAIENGKFTYEGAADVASSRTVVLDYPGKARTDRSHRVVLVPEGGCKIAVVLADSSYVNGSPVTDAYNAFQEEIQAVYAKYNDKILEAYKNDDDATYDELTAKVNEECTAIGEKFFEANNNNYVGVSAVKTLMYDIPLEKLQAFYDNGGDAIKNDKSINKILDSKKAEAATGEGSMFVDFEGKDKDGNPVKLSDYVGKGNYVFMDFWASWCGPCMAALPELRETYDKYHKKGLTVLGVNVWEREEGAGAACMKEKDMVWDVMFTSDNTSTDLYGVTGIPTAFVFGPDGKIVRRGHPMEIKPTEWFADKF